MTFDVWPRTGHRPRIAKSRHAGRATQIYSRSAGYGIAFGCIDGWVGHTGELPGYNTTVYYHAASDSTVVVQTNSDIASGNCAESPTLANDPRDSVCSSPATRIFAAITEALGTSSRRFRRGSGRANVPGNRIFGASQEADPARLPTMQGPHLPSGGCIRLGAVTVRFTMAGGTSFRGDLVMVSNHR